MISSLDFMQILPGNNPKRASKCALVFNECLPKIISKYNYILGAHISDANAENCLNFRCGWFGFAKTQNLTQHMCYVLPSYQVLSFYTYINIYVAIGDAHNLLV